MALCADARLVFQGRSYLLKLAIDWDGTLVDTDQKWLDGARDALRFLVVRHKVLIHSCRANWDGGEQEIRQRLGPLNGQVEIAGKPIADVYIDNQAMRFDGNWPAVLAALRKAPGR